MNGMATVSTKPMTAEEFFDWANLPENDDRKFELEQGEIVPMPSPGERHGVVCANASWIFGGYIRQVNRGRVCANDMGIILERGPDTVRGPDLAVYLSGRAYAKLNRRYPDEMPNVIVEVLSPSDRVGKMLKRINLFLEKGVSVVFLLDPEAQTVSIHRPEKSAPVFERDEEIAGLAELPEFRCRASQFFVSLGP
jgi:Uma2 family endonuclease